MKRILIATALACAACGPHVDLATALAPQSVTTGWADAGTVAGKNKIVPVVSFRTMVEVVAVSVETAGGSDSDLWQARARMNKMMNRFTAFPPFCAGRKVQETVQPKRVECRGPNLALR